MPSSAHQSDVAYSQLQQYRVKAREIRDMLEVQSQPSYIDPCRHSNVEITHAAASMHSAAQERALSALRSPAGQNSNLKDATGLRTDVQQQCVFPVTRAYLAVCMQNIFWNLQPLTSQHKAG